MWGEVGPREPGKDKGIVWIEAILWTAMIAAVIGALINIVSQLIENFL